MKTLFLNGAASGALETCAELIRRGELVAFPTETVYGLGADACNTEAVRKIYEAKGREGDNPLIVHFADAEEISAFAEIEDRALFDTLARAFMPGPLTLILPRKERLSARVSAGLSTVACRVPSHPVARELIRLSATPIAAPSANRSHRPSPTCARHVAEDLDGRIAAILDGGACRHGVESTVLSLGETLRLLRPGAVTREMIEEVTRRPVEVDRGVYAQVDTKEKVASPGMKYRHYAPEAPLSAVVGEDGAVRAFFQAAQAEGAGVLCYEEDLPFLEENERTLSLGSASDFALQAERLFDALRRFDRLSLTRIYTRLPASDGVGLAVQNRLLRACQFDVIEV